MVALRWSEKSRPSSAAVVICCSRNATRALVLMKVASKTSPVSSLIPFLRTTGGPPEAGRNSIVAVVAEGTVTDCSFEKKSFASMVATRVLESGDHAPILCGCLRA